MPLPFLTADRAFDATDDVALPFDDHDQWRRPYRPGPWRVGAAALSLLLASFVLLAAVVIAAAGAVSGAFVTFGLAALIIAAALRALRVGTWVSRHGVRRVGFLTTTTVGWPHATAVRTAQQPVRWLGLPARCRARPCCWSGAVVSRSHCSPTTTPTSSPVPRLSTARPTPWRRGAPSTAPPRPADPPDGNRGGSHRARRA